MIILPSLEIVPAKYNTSTNTLLSQIPIDGTGDFTVSRTTSPVTGQSTRVNALGLIETVPDNVPRLDYPIGGGCPALLVEPSAQNLCLQSAAFATSPWVLTTATSPNTTATTDPFGQTNADLFTATANYGKTQQQVTRTASGTHTVSCFVKGVAGVASIGSLIYNRGVGFTITSGGVVTVNAPVGYTQAATIGVENYGNGWYRIFAVLTHFTTPSTDGILIDSSVSGNSFYIFGAQVEAGSVHTSYIPTTTQSITRAADAISDTTASGVIGQTEGTIYFEAQCFTPDNFSDIIRIEGAGSNHINIIQNASNAYRMDLQASGVTRTITSTVTGVTGFAKIAVAYKTNELAISVNGGAPTTAALSFTFNAALTTIRIAHANYTALRPYRLRAVALYTTRLTNAELQSLTQT